MGKGGGGSLGDSEFTSGSLAINTHFRRCYTVTLGWAAGIGWEDQLPFQTRSSLTVITCATIKMLWLYQSNRVETVLSVAISRISTLPRLPGFSESFDKRHQRLGKKLRLLMWSSVLPKLSHSLSPHSASPSDHRFLWKSSELLGVSG